MHSFMEVKRLQGYSKSLWIGMQNLKTFPSIGQTCSV